MFRAIRDAVPDMSFALFTGDIVAGYIWNTSESYNSASSQFTQWIQRRSLMNVH